MGSWIIASDSHQIAWFTDSDRTAGVDRMKAVIIHRKARRRAVDVPIWRVLLRALSLGFGARPALEPTLPERTSGWSGSVGKGPNQVLYSRERALVAACGREFTLPNDERTLLVLIDARSPAEAVIETHSVAAPNVPRAELDLTAPKAQNLKRMHQQIADARTVWLRWLREEQRIQDFLNPRHGDGNV